MSNGRKNAARIGVILAVAALIVGMFANVPIATPPTLPVIPPALAAELTAQGVVITFPADVTVVLRDAKPIDAIVKATMTSIKTTIAPGEVYVALVSTPPGPGAAVNEPAYVLVFTAPGSGVTINGQTYPRLVVTVSAKHGTPLSATGLA